MYDIPMKTKSNILTAATAIILASTFFLSGCRQEAGLEVDKIDVKQGDNQWVVPNTTCKKELHVEFLSPRQPGLLWGKGKAKPVPGVKPVIELLNNTDLKITLLDEQADAGGRVRIKITSGKMLGDQYFKIYPASNLKKSKTIRVINGINISGDQQEAYSGHALEDPIGITVYNQNGQPVAGVPVYFSVISSPEKKPKAKCKPGKILTNESGVAETHLKVGKETGAYKIMVEVVAAELNMQVRGIQLTAYGKNIWGLAGLIITVLGGLAIFIFGMKSMTDGLQLVAGEKMKQILHFFTSNRFAAVAAGALVTGVIQSSSACTVMVVGFVNAGLLNLHQAVGMVFGANIGTTVTAQIISFKLGRIALPAIVIGLLMIMLSKRSSIKGWGSTLMGFGMLFFGLGIMSHELKLIAKFPSIIEFFQRFDCSPVNGGGMPVGAVLGAILIGTMMTVLIQSSSATIGIALALASSGLINFYTAVPLILGDNIGTTVTANLAALGANRRSKQTAVAHFLFNAIGTTYMVLLFYLPWGGDGPIYLAFINKITAGNVFAGENVTRHIAMAHTMFNIFNVVLFLPFIPQIARLCNIIIPIPADAKMKIKHLEPNLLNTPAVALEQAIHSIRYMVKESWSMVNTAMKDSFLPGKVGSKLARELDEREDDIDKLQSDVTDYLVQITTRQLTDPQAEIIPLLMHCTNDAERIADHTENIISLAQRISQSKTRCRMMRPKN